MDWTKFCQCCNNACLMKKGKQCVVPSVSKTFSDGLVLQIVIALNDPTCAAIFWLKMGAPLFPCPTRRHSQMLRLSLYFNMISCSLFGLSSCHMISLFSVFFLIVNISLENAKTKNVLVKLSKLSDFLTLSVALSCKMVFHRVTMYISFLRRQQNNTHLACH